MGTCFTGTCSRVQIQCFGDRLSEYYWINMLPNQVFSTDWWYLVGFHTYTFEQEGVITHLASQSRLRVASWKVMSYEPGPCDSEACFFGFFNRFDIDRRQKRWCVVLIFHNFGYLHSFGGDLCSSHDRGKRQSHELDESLHLKMHTLDKFHLLGYRFFLAPPSVLMHWNA